LKDASGGHDLSQPAARSRNLKKLAGSINDRFGNDDTKNYSGYRFILFARPAAILACSTLRSLLGRDK